MRTFKSMMFVALLAGCAGADLDGELEADGGEGLDQVEQELSARQGGFGFAQTNAERSSCNTTSTSQTCYVPFGAATSNPKSVRYCLSGPVSGSGYPNFTAAEVAVVQNALMAVDSQTTWAFVNAAGTGNCTLTVRPGAAGAGSSSTNVTAYRSFNVAGTTVLSDGTTPGTWISFGSGTCTLDLLDLAARFPATLDYSNALAQVAGSCAALSVGIGSKSAGSTKRITDMTIMPSGSVPSGLSSKDVCLANSWVGDGPGFWSFTSVTCS